MGENTESLKIFSIVFNNKVMQISYCVYNTIFPEFKNQTVKSLIELILEKSLQANQKKDINEYNFFCPCGNIIESSKSLGKNLCDHKYLDYKNNVNKGKYLLVEKQNQNLYNLIKENEKELSKEEINKIINEKKDIKIKRSNKKKDNSKNVIKNNEINESSKKPFIITDEFKKKINQYIIKEKRANEILSQSYSLFYEQNNLDLLISMGINADKAKAALRISRNQIEEAVLIATDKEFNWEGKDYLYFNNDEVIDKNASNESLKKEVEKEYPFLNEEQVKQRVLDIFELLNKKGNAIIENNELNLDNRLLYIFNHSYVGDDDDDDDEDEEDNI